MHDAASLGGLLWSLRSRIMRNHFFHLATVRTSRAGNCCCRAHAGCRRPIHSDRFHQDSSHCRTAIRGQHFITEMAAAIGRQFGHSSRRIQADGVCLIISSIRVVGVVTHGIPMARQSAMGMMCTRPKSKTIAQCHGTYKWVQPNICSGRATTQRG